MGDIEVANGVFKEFCVRQKTEEIDREGNFEAKVTKPFDPKRNKNERPQQIGYGLVFGKAGIEKKC